MMWILGSVLNAAAILLEIEAWHEALLLFKYTFWEWFQTLTPQYL